MAVRGNYGLLGLYYSYTVKPNQACQIQVFFYKIGLKMEILFYEIGLRSRGFYKLISAEIAKNRDPALQVSSLQSELGYLRQKLADCDPSYTSFSSLDSLTPIYIVTPTYARPQQKAELTRLKNAFLLVPSVHWIVVEDAPSKTPLVTRFLAHSGLASTHLAVETPPEMKLNSDDPHWSKPRGVYQRNAALKWMRQEKDGEPGVVYFADDDNTYSSELFEAIRPTRSVSVLPVGLVGGVMVERPRLSENGQRVIGWEVAWGKSRPYATDMAGFAVALPHLLSRPSALFPTQCKRGHLESEFLKHLVSDINQLEVASSQVLVWHTRTESVNLKKEEKFKKLKGHNSDQGIEV